MSEGWDGRESFSRDTGDVFLTWGHFWRYLGRAWQCQWLRSCIWSVHRDTSTSVHYLAGLLVMVGTGFHLCLDFQAVWLWSYFTYPSILFVPWKEVFLPDSDHRPSPAQLLLFRWESSDSSTSHGFLSQTVAKDKIMANAYFWLFLIFLTTFLEL